MLKFLMSFVMLILTLVFVVYFVITHDIVSGITHLGNVINATANQND